MLTALRAQGNRVFLGEKHHVTVERGREGITRPVNWVQVQASTYARSDFGETVPEVRDDSTRYASEAVELNPGCETYLLYSFDTLT